MLFKRGQLTNYINKIISAKTLEESLDSENKLLGFLMSIILVIATISHIGISYLLNLKSTERIFLTTVLAGASLAFYHITSKLKSLKLRMHLTGIITLITISSTFLIYYRRLGALCWFIVIIVTLVLSFTNDKINLSYNYLTYVILYVITTLNYPDIIIKINKAYGLTLLSMLVIIIGISFVISKVFRGVTLDRIMQYNNIIEVNRMLNEQKKQLYNIAHTDALTKLPNRKRTLETIDQLIAEGIETRVFAVVFVDLDNFKSINDVFGHYVGDKIIENVANRMRNSISETSLIGRLGGDEFALVIRGNNSKASCIDELKTIQKNLLEPFKIENKQLYVTASFGLAFYPYNGDSSTEILKAADTAMYIAKEQGKHNIEIYKKHMRAELLKRIEIETNLSRALQFDEFYLVHHPIVDCLSNDTIGYEILIRWNSRVLGKISPTTFIPIAESIGLIHEIGHWVFKETFKTLNEQHDNHLEGLLITINVSSLQVKQVDFLDGIQKLILDEKINPNNIVLELTESVFIDDIDNAKVIMRKLRNIGFKIALDDFGTGYSSFAYLLDLPVDILKLDKAFLDFNQQDYRKKEIISNIIKMAHILGMKVVAEGIEEQEQLDFIRLEGCDYAQGYLFGMPTPLKIID